MTLVLFDVFKSSAFDWGVFLNDLDMEYTRLEQIKKKGKQIKKDSLKILTWVNTHPGFQSRIKNLNENLKKEKDNLHKHQALWKRQLTINVVGD